MHAVSINIIRKIERMTPARQTSYIHRVHPQLRNWNEKAYDPVFISIGPYHYDRRGNDLKFMEEQKLRYLNALIRRREAREDVPRRHQLRTYSAVLEEEEDRARDYYAETVNLDRNDFIEMMLLDGCFIIEYFRKATEGSNRERDMDPLFKTDWMATALMRDLILFENQIPFFVLEKLNSVFGDEPPDRPSLVSRAVSILTVYSHPGYSHPPEDSAVDESNLQNLDDIKHFLDLFHKFILGEVSQQEGREEEQSVDARGRSLQIGSATELRDSGVRFKSVRNTRFHKIKFERGFLKIPTIRTMDNTEVFFRNLIAYEQHACNGQNRHIGGYMMFMDDLINSSKDVKLLRRKGIIDSLMSDDEAITTMFNKIGKDVVVTSDHFYYRDVFAELDSHRKQRVSTWKAILRMNYLNSPWKIMSIIAASLLLILTFIQTIFTAL